jgi:hypothetical protein
MYRPAVNTAILWPPINLHYVGWYKSSLPSSQTNACVSIRQTNCECCIGKCVLVLRTIHCTTRKVYSVEFRVLTDAQKQLLEYLKRLVNTLDWNSAVTRRRNMIQEYMNSNFVRNKLIFRRITVKILRYFYVSYDVQQFARVCSRVLQYRRDRRKLFIFPVHYAR